MRAALSYQVPEVIVLPIIGGNEDYLKWIDGETAPRDFPGYQGKGFSRR